jgi:hypothetical protein
MAGAYAHWWNKEDHLVTGDRKRFSESIGYKAREVLGGSSNLERTRENALGLLLLAEAGELSFSNLEMFEIQMVAESKES